MKVALHSLIKRKGNGMTMHNFSGGILGKSKLVRNEAVNLFLSERKRKYLRSMEAS